MSGTKVQIRYGYGRPQEGSLKKAELAIDLKDNSLWTADENGDIVRVAHDTTEIEGQIEEIVNELAETVLHNDQVNVIEEGQFQIVFMDDDDAQPFQGRIGYLAGNGPNDMNGSFIFADGKNEKTGNTAILSIGRDADLELHGDNAIRGIGHGSENHKPIIEGFETIQADDFLDADGNSIVGAEAIEATFYESVDLLPQHEDTGSVTREYKNYWVVDDNDGQGNPTRTNIYANGTIEAIFLCGYELEAITFKTNSTTGKFQGSNSFISKSYSIEDTVFGGINILGADAERPPELPYSPDERSVQYALTVTHETLGRTVEIDKEGIIRANDFADMAGNSIVISELDDIPNVSATNPNRDDLLVWTGSNWASQNYDFIQTALNFKGSTNVAQSAPAAVQGDLYVNNTTGTAAASWTGIAGKTLNAGNFVGYANNRWYALGEMADIGVTDVIQGIGISVDDSKPSEPVVAVDRTAVDQWYAAKGHDHSGVYEPVISPKNSAFNKNFGTASGTVAAGDHTHSNYAASNHNHSGVYEPVINPKNSAFNKNFGTTSGTVAAGDHTHSNYAASNHNHSGVYEPVINPKNSGFNKAFGTTPGTVAEGNHTHSQYLTGYTETDPVFKASPAGGITQADINKWNNPASGGTDLPNGKSTGNPLVWNGSNWVEASNVKVMSQGSGGFKANFHISGSQSNNYGSKVFTNFTIGNAASTTAIGKSMINKDGVSSGANDAAIVIGNNNMGGVNAPIYIDTSAGEIVRFNEKEDLGGGKKNRTFYHDRAGNTYVHGGISGPNNLMGTQGAWAGDTTNNRLGDGLNIKSWSKTGTGSQKAYWTVAENLFSGAKVVGNSSVTGDGFKGTAIPYRGQGGDLFSAWGCKQYSTSNNLINGNAGTAVFINNWDKTQTRAGDEDAYKRSLEKWREMMDNPPEQAPSDIETVWTFPDQETGQVILVVPGIMDFDSVLESYQNGEVLTQRTRDQIPTLNELFDCWRMDGKNIVVDLDLAKAHAMQVLRHQARWYYRSAEADAALFGDDRLQDIKDLVANTKATIEGTTKSKLDALDDLVGRLRNDDKEETFLFKDWL